MEFLTPITAIVVAAAAVPLLVLLYFLKLRRTEVPVSSTLLWRRAVQDLQVNAPFQRLRRNLLLLLQLLALLALLAALAQPIIRMRMGPARRVVLLIDHSASMSATDVDPTRLAEAKSRAKQVVAGLRGGGLSPGRHGDQAMVISFAGHAKVRCQFTSDKGQLLAAIDAIEPTDGPSHLGEAVVMAEAFAQSPGEQANNRPSARPAAVELFSDGNISDLADIDLAAEYISFHRIGRAGDNAAVVAMEARRSYEQADQVNVFASLANFGASAVDCDVQLSVDGSIRAVRGVHIPAAEQQAQSVGPGRASATFDFAHPGSAVIEVRLLWADALEADNAAWDVLAPPKRLAVLLVTEGNAPLASALGACGLARLDVAATAEFDSMAAPGAAYDLIVLDNCPARELSRGQYLVFGPPPSNIGVQTAGPLSDQVVIDWRSRHPLLQHVNLSNLFAARCHKLTVGKDAEVLAEFNDTPAIVLVRRGGSDIVLVGFDIMQTNWPFESSFVMFCYNAVNLLGMDVADRRGSQLHVGQPIIVHRALAERAELHTPDSRTYKIAADATGTFRYPAAQRAGVYRLEADDGSTVSVAVNLLDENESNIAPHEQLVISHRTVSAEPDQLARTNMELWPLLAMAGLVLVCVEWIVYNSRVRLR